MPVETIDCFCRHCNSVISAEVRATALGGPTEDLLEHLEPGEEGFRWVRYTLAFCRKCESVFLYRSGTTEPSEFQYEELLYPRGSEPLSAGVPPSVRRPYESAVSCFATANYEPCVLMCCKAVEEVCVLLGENDGTIEQRLRRLRDCGVLEARLYDWADALRGAGDGAACELSLSFSKNDARNCLDFVEAVLVYVFTPDRRFQGFRQRRGPSEGAS